MIIKLQRQPYYKYLIWILFLGSFFIAPLIQLLKMPALVKYILDLAWFILLITMFFEKKNKLASGSRVLYRWIIMFLGLTVINYIFHYQSLFYYLWGFRNNFRVYVLFFAVIYYVNTDDVEKMINILYKIFYVDIIVMFIQFFMLGYKQDNLGGIFGVETGCNGYVNLFFCIMVAVNYIRYCNEKQSFKTMAVNIIMMLILAAMAELKFFYVEFVVIILVGTLINRFSWRKCIVIIVGIVALIVGYHIFASVFPTSDMSLDGLWEYASNEKGYTSSGDLNRIGFRTEINKKFLNDGFEQAFGLGLGNCDHADGIGLVTTSFYKKYEDLHYTWLSSAFMYLENGMVGLVLFLGFFVLIFIFSFRMKKKSNEKTEYTQIAMLCSVIAILCTFYNSSLRIESGYMIYFMLAIPWCSVKKRIENTSDDA